VSVFAFCVIGAFILFGLIKSMIGLRVSEEEEIEGLDINEHGNIAYPDFVSTMSGISKSFTSGTGTVTDERVPRTAVVLAEEGGES
jgi:hypothetical protein